MTGRRTIFILAALAILALAGALRVPKLDMRPLHGDEAVNTFKFNNLWQDRTYRYDPTEYHGPVLPYATLPAVALSRAGTFAQTREAHYRVVTVIFGIMLVALTLAFAGGIGHAAALVAALLVAISMGLTYYSRYYIHEMPLVVFTLTTMLCGWRYIQTRRPVWAILCGASLGLMHATKETAIIAWFAMVVALGTLALWRSREAAIPWKPLLRWRPLLGGVLAAAFVSVMLFSNFFTDARGPLDSLLTFASYLDRGTGGEPLHVQPWYWYLSRLAFHRPVPGGPWYSEALILILALAGGIAAAARPGVHVQHLGPARFLAIYALVMAAVYCLIPYKTPWSIMSLLHALTLLAGIGFVAIVRLTPTWVGKGLVILVLAAGAAHLGYQDYRANFVLHMHRTNPYRYAHPNQDVVRIGEEAEALAQVGGPQTAALVLMEQNLWPIPFYLRRIHPVGYPETLQEFLELTGPPDAPLAHIIIVPHPRVAEIMEHYGSAYVGPRFFGVRRGVLVARFVRRDLWGQYMETR